MGIIKDAILKTLQDQGVTDAHWVGNEPPRVIKSAAQSKYDDVRAVERNYTRGKGKALAESAQRVCYNCAYMGEHNYNVGECTYFGSIVKLNDAQCWQFKKKGE